MKNTIVGIIALLLFTTVIPGFSVIHSRYYIEDQKNAQEYLRIEVQQVSKDWCFVCSSRDIRVTAKVIEVMRTGNNITPGTTIELRYRYTAPSRGRVGPGTLPLLEKGRIYPAFLNKTGNGSFYIPAAGPYSFTPLDNQNN